MRYQVEPQVAGELGRRTVLDNSTHPPKVTRLEFVLDQPEPDDLLESFPVFLVSESLSLQLKKAHLTGFKLANATLCTSESYREVYGAARHQKFRWLQVDGKTGRSDFWLNESFRLCVSERAMAVLKTVVLSNCLITEAAE